MEELVSVSLRRIDFGQLLDGVEVLIEQWEATERYLSSGEITEDVCIRESHHAHEAEAIAKYYRTIADQIQQQLDL